jgi:uncharacterized secreted repeat protein (TIGR03808 family)
MDLHRRSLLAAGLGLGAAAGAARTASAGSNATRTGDTSAAVAVPGLRPGIETDQTAILQAAIDAAAERDHPVVLPPGRIVISDLRLRGGSSLIGSHGATVLAFGGGEACLSADKADDVMLRDLIIDGRWQPFNPARGDGLVSMNRGRNIVIENVTIKQSVLTGLSLTACSGRIAATTVLDMLDAGIRSLDASGLLIASSVISRCGNNGIQIWRSEQGQDGTIVSHNRITNIRNAAGGSGEYGNGINVFRAGGVLVSDNVISHCSYSAVRGNAADNLQIIANACTGLGEVALYAEFGFQGAVIANNVVDGAATGIAVTNFNDGGRLAVVQGNLIRNLVRREHEPVDKRGIGIGVEADTAVTGNTIEGAPDTAIQVGWGPYMRNVAVNGNVIRQARVGITVTGHNDAGSCLIANNVIADTRNGAIRTMHHGEITGPDLGKAPGANTTGGIVTNGNITV